MSGTILAVAGAEVRRSWAVSRLFTCPKKLLGVALVWSSAGCAGAATQPVVGGSKAATEAAAVLTWSRGDWPAELLSDPDWQAAARGDEWALLRLGERRAELERAIHRGGPAALVAFRAWPRAELAWQERGVLCRAVPRYPSGEWAPLFQALHQSAASETSFGETLDPDAALGCERALDVADQQVATMPAEVFDEYAATCQALGRVPRGRGQ